MSETKRVRKSDAAGALERQCAYLGELLRRNERGRAVLMDKSARLGELMHANELEHAALRDRQERTRQSLALLQGEPQGAMELDAPLITERGFND